MTNQLSVKASAVLAAAVLALVAGVPARAGERSLDLRPPVSAETFVLARGGGDEARPAAMSSFAEDWSPKKKWIVGGVAAAVVIGLIVIAASSGGSDDNGSSGY